MLGFYRTYTTPFKEKIPASVEDFFRRVPVYKRFARFFGRYLYAEIALRNSKKIEKITHKHKKILWIQWVDSYLGDSLMDLSSRVLFNDKNIDLLTKENVAIIYQNDEIFERIYTNPQQCINNDYDLIIIDSYRQRSLKIIKKYFSRLSHVTLFGYYNVDDFNRLYFSFYRINQLLSNAYNEQYIKSIAKPSLSMTNNDIKTVNHLQLPKQFIAIAVGGANKERTFNKWRNLIVKLLDEKLIDNIVLIGSKNAQKEANFICKLDSNKIINAVGGGSFKQSAEIINRAKILVCADGGLLHAANAVKTPVVGLFYYIDPAVRLINVNKSIGLVDKKNINNIDVDCIVKKVKLILGEF